jgi:primosomal protein N' (replication factor Y) (superfamily II helicase)
MKMGIGTEKVFSQLRKYFPGARIERMDRDTTQNRGEYKRIITEVESGGVDILVGTQMIAKGLDFPGVTLVGVISADSILNLPDFRSAERTFQLLTQVAGRAGRRDAPGRVIIQTFAPEHPAVAAACAHDHDKFYDYEIEMRRAGRFPPFTRMVNFVISSPEQAQARELALRLETLFRAEIEPLTTDTYKGIFGPAEAPLYKLMGKYRWFVGVRGESLIETLQIASAAYRKLSLAEKRLTAIDVFPVNIL